MATQRKKMKKTTGTPFGTLMARENWHPLPTVVVLVGNAPFLKELVLRRFEKEVFGEDAPDLRRFTSDGGAQSEGPPLATILDELRTPSFFSASRVVVVAPADGFVTTHSATLLEHIESGFVGGHLVVFQNSLDQRTRWGKQIGQKGWIVECRQPYDRPPPWDLRTAIWDSELSQWVSQRARDKGLSLSPQNAFHIHSRVGTDLAVLDEELEKLATYVAGRSDKKVAADRVTKEAIEAVIGDLREDSVFSLVDLVLERRLPEALESTHRLFERGQQTERGTRALDPMSIALPFIAALAGRLRGLRQGHALNAVGRGGSEGWLKHGLVQRPFLARFERQLETTHPTYIRRLFRRLYEVDRALKLGASAPREIELLVVLFSAPESAQTRRQAGPGRN